MLTKTWLSKRVFCCLILTSFFGVISYQFWDNSIVLYLNAHHAKEWSWAIRVRRVANILSILPEYASAPIFLYFAIRILLGNLKEAEKKFLILMLALIIAYYGLTSDYVRSFFGRAWPSTWTHHNPSFLTNDIYGFHLGIDNKLYTSFPSGHSTIATLLATFAWYYFPRFCWYVIAYAIFVMFIMVIQYYHFLSDVIVGAAVGYLVMIYFYYSTKQHLLELPMESGNDR